MVILPLRRWQLSVPEVGPPSAPPLTTDDAPSASSSFPDFSPNVVDANTHPMSLVPTVTVGDRDRSPTRCPPPVVDTTPRPEASTRRLQRCSAFAFSVFDDAAPGGAVTAATTHSISNNVQQQCSAAVTMFYSSNNAQRQCSATMYSNSNNVPQRQQCSATMFHNSVQQQQQQQNCL